jgi:hypothetical protein
MTAARAAPRVDGAWPTPSPEWSTSRTGRADRAPQPARGRTAVSVPDTGAARILPQACRMRRNSARQSARATASATIRVVTRSALG